MEKNSTIQLELTIEEVNKILQVLGEVPYKQVFQLINRIQHQAAGQLEPKANYAANGVEE